MIKEERRTARRCPTCGEEGLRVEARFCDRCGVRLFKDAERSSDNGLAHERLPAISPEEPGDTQPGLDTGEDEGATRALVADQGDERERPHNLPDSNRTKLEAEAGPTAALSDEAGATALIPDGLEEDEDEGATGFLPPAAATAAADGATGTMAEVPPEEEGATRLIATDEEDTADAGQTQFMGPEARADDAGATRVMQSQEAPEDEGQTRAIAASGEDTDEGVTDYLPPRREEQDEGATKFIPERPAGEDEDEGATRAVADISDTNPGLARQTAPKRGTPTLIETRVAANHVMELQDRYQLLKILGKGGFGAVYLAEDVKLQRRCVVKQMLTRGRSSKEIEISRTNFEREAKLLVDLNDPGHPNIPEIYDYFSVDSGNYLVMKYIEGRNLKDALESSEGRLPWQEAVRYAIDVCSALSYMHTHGGEPVLHRDIKPANIQLGDDGRVWLVDFGLAKADPVQGSDDNMMATQASGSFGYTPLEQWIGQAVPVSDIYALGATLHHLLTGLNPLEAFEGEFHIQKIQDLHGNFTPIRKVDRDLPTSLEDIIKGALDPVADKRPSARQLQQQLEMVISGGQETALYTFKSGESAKTVEALVDLCEAYRQEAQNYLYTGDFERWFLLINRNDLVAAARQAVAEGSDERDGLRRFLKLILPNILQRRLKRIGFHLMRGVGVMGLVVVAVALLAAIGGSYLTGVFAQQTIGGAAWPFHLLDLDEPTVYDEALLNEVFNEAAGVYFDEAISVDLEAPDQIRIETTWNGIELDLPVTLRLEDKKPHFYLDEINGFPLFFVGNNISGGINRGVDQAFERAPVDISSLVVEDEAVVFDVTLSGRTPFATPTPAPTLTPTPVPTPTPVDAALVVIFNEIDQDIILDISGDTWSASLDIAGEEEEVIEVPAGVYRYTVILRETGEIISEGERTWTLKQAYRLRLGVLQ